MYRMKRPRGRSLLLLLTPDELLARLATLVPPPRVHGLRYHGVFAPNSKARQRVVPEAPEPVPSAPVTENRARTTEKPRCVKSAEQPARTHRIPWADLLRKVYGMLVAFQSLMQSFLQPVSEVVNLGGTIQQLQGDLTRLDDILHEAIDPRAHGTGEPGGPPGPPMAVNRSGQQYARSPHLSPSAPRGVRPVAGVTWASAKAGASARPRTYSSPWPARSSRKVKQRFPAGARHSSQRSGRPVAPWGSRSSSHRRRRGTSSRPSTRGRWPRHPWLAADQILGRGGLTTGTFLAFNTAFGAFIGGAAALSNTLVEALRNLALLERVQPILEGEPEVDSRKADPGPLSGGVKLDHVTFRYRSDGPITLADVSLRAEPGEFVAIVGPSGSGKSTLLRLLLGFEQPESGAVYYDGQILAGLDVQAVRRQLGVVLQGSNVLAGSIFENIAAGATLTFDDAWAAVRDAGLEEDLAGLPMGMHTYVSEGGTNLSGEERQRLLIARALARRPSLVFFDEATSALDNRTQAIVSRSLDRLRVTRIVIAHRLSTIQSADRVYVMEAGRVVQQGTVAALSARAGELFARMMARQML